MGLLFDIAGARCEPEPIGLDGKPVRRPRWQYPYSYDAYQLYKSADFRETDAMVYSDRLWEWSPAKFRKATAAVWPKMPRRQIFEGCSPTEMQKFLRLYLGEDVKLTALYQGCNVGNGYPYWILAYRPSEN